MWNFYLSFLRYPIHILHKKPKEAYQWVSGVPLLGSLLVGLSLVQLYTVPVALWIAIVLILIDTGGIHWFIGSMIYHARKEGNSDLK